MNEYQSTKCQYCSLLDRHLGFIAEVCTRCGVRKLSELTQSYGGYEAQLANPVNPFQKLISQYGTRKKSGETK